MPTLDLEDQEQCCRCGVMIDNELLICWDSEKQDYCCPDCLGTKPRRKRRKQPGRAAGGESE